MSFGKKFSVFLFGIIIPMFLVTAKIIPINDEVVFWPNTKTSKFNTYETDYFRFDYAPNFSVKKWNNIIFLEENTSKNTVWALFTPIPTIRYKINDFACFSHLTKDKVNSAESRKDNALGQKQFCTKKLKNPHFIKNLVLFPKKTQKKPIQLDSFQSKGFFKNYDPNTSFSRGEMVALTLKLKYPKKDFSQYAERCFFDVPIDHKYSGEICWAKNQDIIMGIDQNFYPQSSINVWGILKILSLTFERDWPEPNWEKIPPSFMTKLHKEHIAAPMLAAAWEYGVLKNTANQSLWANRAVRQKEVIQIISDFLDWNNGKVIKAWKLKNYTPPISRIFYQQDHPFSWKKKKTKKEKYRKIERKIIVENLGDTLRVWMEDHKGFFISNGIINTPSEKISEIRSWFNFEKWEGEIEITLASGTTEIFRPNIKKSQFIIPENYKQTTQESIAFLEKHKRSPKLITTPDYTSIPIFDIEMSNEKFEYFFTNTTRDTRYPATLKTTYPNGEIEKYSILLKARGNANRGYIKPSLTIESFHDFRENKKYHGDEFLEENNEIKLRSFINEETMIHEKLFYRSSQALGHPAPDFFEALVRINNVPFGAFQITEPIKKQFFKRRDLTVSDYFYAQNINAKFDTNLGYYDSDEKTLSAYKIKGDDQKLLNLIKSLNKNDPALLTHIDIQSVFDYASLIWISNAWDSLTHNYYLFWNQDTAKWEIFPWDADLAWKNIPKTIDLDSLDIFAQNETGNHNILINYVFSNITKKEKQELWNVFCNKWEKYIKLSEWTEEYRTNHKKYFEYDNKLWNGRFLERKKYIFDTNVALLKLKRELKKISNIIK